MSFSDSFSARARRAVFRANAQAHYDGVSEVSAEHILLGVLREDPQLFVLLAPANANLVGEIEESLATNAKASVTETRKQVLRLSKNAKEIIRVAARERVRLGHKSVGTQHLLLALLRCPEERTSWFRRLRRQNDSVARQVLTKSGLKASSVESAIKAGIVTPLTWVLDDSIVKLNAQLTAIAELLISKGIFTRCQFVALLDENAGPITRDAFLLPLIDALVEKGKLTQAEKEMLSIEQSSKPAAEKT